MAATYADGLEYRGGRAQKELRVAVTVRFTLLLTGGRSLTGQGWGLSGDPPAQSDVQTLFQMVDDLPEATLEDVVRGAMHPPVLVIDRLLKRDGGQGWEEVTEQGTLRRGIP